MGNKLRDQTPNSGSGSPLLTEVGQGENSPSNTQREEQVGQAAGCLEEGETHLRDEVRIASGALSKKDSNKVVANLRVVLHRPLFIFIQPLCLLGGGRGKQRRLSAAFHRIFFIFRKLMQKKGDRSKAHVEFGASPPQLDAKDFEDFPHLQDDNDSDNNHRLILRLRSLLLNLQPAQRPEYLHAGSQSDGEQHQQAGLLQQVEEHQQGAEAAP